MMLPLMALAATLTAGDTSGVFILHKIGNPIGKEANGPNFG